MELTQKDLDALSGQLISLYKDLPGNFRLVDEQALKTNQGLQNVLTRMNELLNENDKTVVLVALKFAILAVLFQQIHLAAQQTTSPTYELPPLSEADIASEIQKKYSKIYTALHNTDKSPQEILGEHRNILWRFFSKLFGQKSPPRSFSMFGTWITKTTRGTALDPDSFTDLGDEDDDSYVP